MFERSGQVGPLAYGYLHIHGLTDDVVAALEDQLGSRAGELGLTLVKIFAESDRGTQAAFGDLLDELRRARADHVLVPTVCHFSAHPLLRALMLGRLHRCTGAEVHAVVGSTTDTHPAG